MKKSLLFVAALFAAVAMNAKEITVNLSSAVEEQENGSATVTASASEVSVNWNVTVGYGVAGFEVQLGENLASVTGLSFEYKGDGSAHGLIHYLRDSEGSRWWDDANWLDMEAQTWTNKSVTPAKCLWDGATYPYGTHPIAAVGFIANPDNPASGTFAIKNVKLIVPDGTGIDNTAIETKATKVFRDGQMVILRDGKAFNALGAEVK